MSDGKVNGNNHFEQVKSVNLKKIALYSEKCKNITSGVNCQMPGVLLMLLIDILSNNLCLFVIARETACCPCVQAS